MKKIFYLLFGAMLSTAQSLPAQVGINIAHDSLQVSLPVDEPEINFPSSITNQSGGTVTIRWTRVIEQIPPGWNTAFCDKNLCWLGSVSTQTFDLENGEDGLLKPIFEPNEIVGTGIVRLYYNSETQGVTWADTAVYVGIATELVSTFAVERVRDIIVFPNPAQEVLHVVAANANLQGGWRITDATGKVWKCTGATYSAIPGQIPLEQLPSGIYFFQVNTSNGHHLATKRFIIQRS